MLNYRNAQNGYSYVHGNPVNYTDPTGLARIKIWAAAFISPPSIDFPIPYSGNPLLSNVTATFEGDGRSFYTGGTPSSRVWHEIELDTSNPAYYIISNRTDTGVTRASWQDIMGRNSYYAAAKAPAPAPADIVWQGSSIFVHMEAHAGNPLALGAPAIDYRYVIEFDLHKGEVTMFGYHDWYPWHELYLEVDGVAVRPWPIQYSPIGSTWPENPFSLGYLPQPVEYTETIPGLLAETTQYCVSPLVSSMFDSHLNDAFREWGWLTLLLD